jgi:hypothetical protein
MAQIKLVADTTDAFTRKVLKEKWENASPSLQKRMLARMGHSDKWVGSKYSDLTHEIQSKIIVDRKSV